MNACFRALFLLVLLVGLPVRAEEETPGWTVLAAAGVQEGLAREGEPLVGLRLGVRPAKLEGWGVSLYGALGRGPSFWEMNALVWLGHRWGARLGSVTLSAGLDAGVGVAALSSRSGSNDWRYGGIMAGGAVWAGLALPLSGPLTLNLEAQVPVLGALGGREGDLVVVPGAWLGLAWTP
jgi:hypothetical protein